MKRNVLFFANGLACCALIFALALGTSAFAQNEGGGKAVDNPPAVQAPGAEAKELAPGGPAPVAQKRSAVKIPGKKTLPLKLVTRPFAGIYEAPDSSGKPVVENVPTFSIFFAYSTPEQNPGWYEVGTDNRGAVKGWMKADDVIEWKQYLSLTFTNPAGRQPALFFSAREKLTELAADPSRVDKVQSIRQTIDETLKDPQKEFPEGFPVGAMEPADFVDVHVGPYLLPILSAEQLDIDGKPTRILEVASAVKGSRKETAGAERPKAPIRDGFVASKVDDAVRTPAVIEIMKEWKTDIVFVIDATASMQPYIDGTREVVKQIAAGINDSKIGGKICFGLVAYRDDASKIKGMDYTARIFCNLEDGADIGTFNKKVSDISEATVGSQGFDEDAWAGIVMALNDAGMKARPDASLFIIHIGDASAHNPSDPLATTGLDSISIRDMANSRAAGGKSSRATIVTLHLQTPEAAKANDVGTARDQYKTIVGKAPNGDLLYFPVADGDADLFKKHAATILTTFVEAQKAATQKGETTSQPAPAPDTPVVIASTTPEKKIEDSMKGAMLAAQIEYIGSRKTEKGEAKAPRDIRAFTADRDLEDSSKRPMAVNLIITKNNLDEVKKSLEGVIEAGTKAQISGGDFFDELQSVMASSVRDPRMVKKGLELNKIGLMPEFLEGLPYKSEILNMTNEDWSKMSMDEQSEFLTKVKAKITLYQSYYNDREKWIELNKGDEPGDWIMLLDLNALP